jgi:hypothetical protein
MIRVLWLALALKLAAIARPEINCPEINLTV